MLLKGIYRGEVKSIERIREILSEGYRGDWRFEGVPSERHGGE